MGSRTSPVAAGGRRSLRFAIIAAAMLAACKFSARVQGDAATDGDPLPDATTCAAASVECVSENTLRTCSGPDTEAVDVRCAWGCRAAPVPYCARLVPSADALLAGDVAHGEDLLAVTLTGGTIIDGDTGKIGMAGGNEESVRMAGSGIKSGIDYELRGTVAVFRVNALTIQGNVSLIGSKAIAFAVDGDVIIDGVLAASGPCTGTIPGPGGFSGGIKLQNGNGPAAGTGGRAGTGDKDGGGGGGHGGTGGSGGNDPTAVGGTSYGVPEIAALLGGAGGGGAGGGGAAGVGGGGGGALQIASNARITIMAGGGINAGGCGGTTGTGGNDGGGGGGAGGTILLEASAVEILGTLAVNGGGGGGGDGTAGAGANGRLDREPAAGSGGAGINAAGGDGAAGAVANGAPGIGNPPDDGGGGGGAIGRVRINTRSGTATVTGTLSPAFDDPASTCTQGTVVLE